MSDKTLEHIEHHIIHEDANPLCTEYIQTHEAIVDQLTQANARILILENELVSIRDELAKCIIVISEQPQELREDFKRFSGGIQKGIDEINEALQSSTQTDKE